jgi:hypothetical protein
MRQTGLRSTEPSPLADSIADAQSKTRANKEAERCPPLLRSGARSSVIPEHGDHHLPLGVPSNHRRFIKSAAPTICPWFTLYDEIDNQNT